MDPDSENTNTPPFGVPQDISPHYRRLAEVFERHYDGLVGWLVAQLRSVDAARDVAQEAFKRLLSVSDPPDTVEGLTAYLYATARNLLINRVQRGARQVTLAEIYYDEPAKQTPTPELSCIEQQRSQVMLDFINALPVARRIAFRLRIWDDLTFTQIAAQLADQGIRVNEKTIRRHFAEDSRLCKQAIEAAERPKKEVRR